MPSQLVLLFLIDNSSSTFGSKLSKIDHALVEIIEELQEINEVELRAASMLMTSDDVFCKWMNETPIAIEDFNICSIEAHGHTPIVESLQSANKWIEKNNLDPAKVVVLIMTDGEFGFVNISSITEQLQGKVLERCRRVVCLVDSASDDDLVESISSENDYIVHDGEHIPSVIRRIIVNMASVNRCLSKLE